MTDGPAKFKDLSVLAKGHIAELAVMMRAVSHGIEVFRPTVDGCHTDAIMVPPSGELCKIQIKLVRTYPKRPKPHIDIRMKFTSGKPVKYEEGAYDFLIGYDAAVDRAYIYTASELSSFKAAANVTEDAAERWDKILGDSEGNLLQ